MKLRNRLLIRTLFILILRLDGWKKSKLSNGELGFEHPSKPNNIFHPKVALKTLIDRHGD